MTLQQLDTLINIARTARDTAGVALAGERLNQQQLSSQIEMLSNYRREYSQRLQETMAEGIDLATLQDYQGFLYSLDQAISRAKASLDQQLQRVNRCQENWQQEQRRLSSYDTLAARRDARLNREQERREMRESDEFTTNSYARKNSIEKESQSDSGESV